MNSEFLNASVPNYASQQAFPGVFEFGMPSATHPIFHYNLIIRNLIEENQKLNKELTELRKNISQQTSSKTHSEPQS